MAEIKPYINSKKNKKEQVAQMFNSISSKYDFLNHVLSLNIDKLWRKKLIKIISKNKPQRVLDIATGTGDLAIAALKCNPIHIDGIDISEGMLSVGIQKIKKKKIDHLISLSKGDAENIPFDSNYFDAVTVAFGVRNFENLDNGLQEMYRVLNTGGICAVLEFTMPIHFPVKQIYKFYFNNLLPFFGRIISKDSSAYTYLPNSVKNFAQRDEFIKHMESAGFKNNYYKTLSFGIAAIYIGYK